MSGGTRWNTLFSLLEIRLQITFCRYRGQCRAMFVTQLTTGLLRRMARRSQPRVFALAVAEDSSGTEILLITVITPVGLVVRRLGFHGIAIRCVSFG